ncbi:leucine-rich repeat domain-containing protein [Tenacibaculum amylolyticum]|uniref:leucine-rich repeat domain-containing protein n=1 Tax=Tenacibaculum amylolyticum TaxID=104269 RepID=UPI003895D440
MKSKITELLEREEGVFIETLINAFSNTEETIIEFADTEDEKNEPTSEQLKTCEYILNNADKIVSNIKQYIYEEREVLEDIYNSYGLKPESYFELNNSWKNITIEKIIIHSENKNGIAYYGIVGECKWDEEHGFGVTMLNDVIVELGDWCTGVYCYGTDEDEKESLAEKYGLELLSKRKEQLAELAKNIKEENIDAYLNLFDWLLSKRAIYGYRSSKVDLSDKEKVAFLQNITYLDLMDKEIKELPSSFLLLQKLSGLSLEHNMLEEVPNCFQKLLKLESIGLSYNQISKVPEKLVFSEVMKRIEMRENKLSELQKEKFKAIYSEIEISF